MTLDLLNVKTPSCCHSPDHSPLSNGGEDRDLLWVRTCSSRIAYKTRRYASEKEAVLAALPSHKAFVALLTRGDEVERQRKGYAHVSDWDRLPLQLVPLTTGT